ncbi:YceI family protein [Riemerella anatipestifer]|uniref:YceI family protein n=1 Tax=Riemerella anatipestifer TaxID=34085 RepID=UPI000D687766|nr:YceI family protein [Riemerella anatipestifer]MDR7693515.1 YceI family protein [Riemerella anatipestifer]MDR7793628.1 YceI family protein [Riemerella anatipestifer]MRM85193.1 YceI family protein [Riemerella anatipestifer]MRM94391.1 YceI family protein [Riemerella anatipestifer]WPC11246.1 YceI family protein [Riemerella anatipestifer]
MKKNILSLFFATSIGLLALNSCGKDKPLTSESNEVTTTKEGQVYAIDTATSKIEWKGYKVVKSDNTSHFGDIKFESGEITVKDGKLESGKFVANMNTLANRDITDDAEKSAKLDGHLKNEDFFEVEKFPTSSFEITKVTEAAEGDYNTLLDGNLTIKGITKPVQFKANIKVEEGKVSIKTEPTDIKREDFGVKFQMPVANGVIKNEVTVHVSIDASQLK